MSTTRNTTMGFAHLVLGQDIFSPSVKNELRKIDPNARPDRDEDELDWLSLPGGLWVGADPITHQATTVAMYSSGVEGHDEFKGSLPHAIQFTWRRDQVLAALRPPDRTGPTHDSWIFDAYRLVVDYAKTGRIERVGVTTLKAKPSDGHEQ